MPVTRRFHGLGKPQQLLGIDKALGERDFFRAGDFQALAFFDDVDELRGFQQRLMRAGIEPRITAAEPFDMKLAAFEVSLVQIGDLQFAPR